jgi:transitional endoplasmic reticulum ATPase
MNLLNSLWPDQVRRLLNHANIALQQNDRATAHNDMAQAAELLFLQAKNENDLEMKKCRIKQGTKLLKTAVQLVDEQTPNVTPDSGISVRDETADVLVSVSSKTRGKTLTFDDVDGLEDVKKILRNQVIYPLQHPEKREKYGIAGGGGMLLYGPPGTGKTLLVRAIAGELALPFFHCKCSELIDSLMGASEKNLANLFADARSQLNGALVFLDELDAIGGQRREQTHEASRRLLTQLLQELDGVDGRSEKLIFFGATNDPEALDKAFRPPRFRQKCLVPLPDIKARQGMFKRYLQNCPMNDDVRYDLLAARSEGFSGADIENICEGAKLIPFCESVLTGCDRSLSQQDIDEVMKNVKPSVSPEDVRRYENWYKNWK